MKKRAGRRLTQSTRIQSTRIGIAVLSLGRLWCPLPAAAQSESPPDGVTIGDFWFRPSLELRVRGEYDHHPAAASAVELPVLGVVPVATATGADNQWVVHERTRVGLSAERGVLSAALVVQDARVAGIASPARIDRSDPTPALGLHTAFFELRSPEGRTTFVRVGRQEVSWGDGRLLGISDWSLTPRALDAIRVRLDWSRLDIEGLAVLLAPPGAVPPEFAATTAAAGAVGTGSGAQLYGLLATLHLDPLLHAEVAGLARVARSPLPPTLTSGETFVADARVRGDRAGLTYAAEVAYEFGRFASLVGQRRLAAWGASVRVGWQSPWLFKPKLELQASYASGDDGERPGPSHRFDPILPDDRAGLGQMGLYAWSNTTDAALVAALYPVEDLLSITFAYRFVRLTDPAGAWFSASLLPVGQAAASSDSMLGHELDATVTYLPVSALAITAGYGAFITGPGARAVLRGGGADGGTRLLSSAFLQARLAAP